MLGDTNSFFVIFCFFCIACFECKTGEKYAENFMYVN